MKHQVIEVRFGEKFTLILPTGEKVLCEIRSNLLDGGDVKVAIDAPRSVIIHRKEIHLAEAAKRTLRGR